MKPITARTAKDLLDLLPSMPILGKELNLFFSALKKELDDTTTKAQTTGEEQTLTIRIIP